MEDARAGERCELRVVGDVGFPDLLDDGFLDELDRLERPVGLIGEDGRSPADVPFEIIHSPLMEDHDEDDGRKRNGCGQDREREGQRAEGTQAHKGGHR